MENKRLVSFIEFWVGVYGELQVVQYVYHRDLRVHTICSLKPKHCASCTLSRRASYIAWGYLHLGVLAGPIAWELSITVVSFIVDHSIGYASALKKMRIDNDTWVSLGTYMRDTMLLNMNMPTAKMDYEEESPSHALTTVSSW